MLLHYKVLGKLGEGGMGIVYKVLDTHLNRTLVLKVLRNDEAADAARERRFLQEARTASLLNHPNIITIHDLASTEGLSFIVMEYVPGSPLDFLIPSGGLPASDVIRYGVQIADALSAAHDAGVIHRDLKPANVMVTPSGLVKLLDFGLAKLTRGKLPGEAALTSAGSIIGTVCYMSPEQAAAQPLDARSDIFSFGTLLYEMATGRRAFNQASPVAALSALLREKPPPLPQSSSQPAALGELIARCLEKEPARRYASAAEVRAALQAIQPEAATSSPADPCEAAEAALERMTAASLQEARDCYEHAMADGPRGPIYAGMAEYYALTALLGMREPSDAAAKSVWAATKAIEMEPNSEKAHVTLGLIRANHDLRWAEGGALLEHARSPHHRILRALFYWRPLGAFDKAAAGASGDSAALAWIALEQGDLAAAQQHSARADLESWIGMWVHACTLLAHGRAREAIETCQAAQQIEPGNAMVESALAAAYAMHRQTETARRLVDRPVWRPAWFAMPFHFVLGETDRAFEAARHALHRRDPGLITMLRLPLMRPWVSDPRYRELLSALGV
jgi:tRNA A-37 threonylcarbamoyl transferase component Bud32